jgi:small subunit ribosomal protein S1
MGKDDDSFAALFETSQQGRARPRPRRGDRLEVRVVAFSRDAVFVDLGGKQEGFFDRVDLLAQDGSLMVKEGATVSAVVVDSDGERVKLSPVFVRTAPTESLIEDGDQVVAIPRAKSGPLLLEGAHVRGAITGIERYGVFVQIAGTQGRNGRGLVPTAETATPRGADLKKHFTVGQEVEAKILAIQEDGKIRLSFKALTLDAERADFEAFRGQSSATGNEAPSEGGEKPTKGGEKPERKKPEPKSFGTLGDLFKKR